MPMRPPVYRPLHLPTREERRRDHDARRTEAQPWRRWYWTARWRRLAASQLAADPICACCLREGRVTPATVAHHVTPHRGDPTLFWEGPIESVCQPCHDGPIAREERGGAR